MRSETNLPAAAVRAAEWLVSRGAGRPGLAIVLGSGMSGAVSPSPISLMVDFEEIPGFPRVSVSGHPGRLLAGPLQGLDVVVLEGRAHLYEGMGLDAVRLPSATVAAMGAEMALLTSACGGLGSGFRAGDFVVVRDHLVYPSGSPAASPGRPEGPDSHEAARGGRDDPAAGLFPGAQKAEGCEPKPEEAWSVPRRSVGRGFEVPVRRQVYSRRLSAALERACIACRAGWRRGILAFSVGPCYETAAEARALKMAGADVVSMSAAAEAVGAAAMGLEVACICCVTNVIGVSAPCRADHRSVVESAQRSRDTLGAVICEFTRRIARGGRAE